MKPFTPIDIWNEVKKQEAKELDEKEIKKEIQSFDKSVRKGHLVSK